jgi:putative peptide zinc metalloprotease protein
MTVGPFLSASWYRVANLRPRLRQQSEIARHRYRGCTWYVIRNALTGQVHRLSPSAYMLVSQMDGERTIDQLWTTAASSLGDAAPSQDEVLQLCAQLHGADIIHCDIAPDVAEAFSRLSKQQRSKALQILLNPTSIKIPFWDPDSFLTWTLPYVRPLIGRLGGVLWIAVLVSALIAAAPRWSELTENLSDRVFAADNLLLLSLIYPIIKLVHEFGHAYTAKAYGTEVREMGVMFILFMPMPYVDVSGSSSFRSKYRRATVAAAGIIVELFIAALALHIWLLVEPGLLRAVAFNVLIIASVSTVVFNGNPLMRYDGYHVLADLIEIPNLAMRASRYCGYAFDKYVLGKRDEARFPGLLPHESPWLLFYAPAAFIYRGFVQIGIAFYLINKAFAVGVILALWSTITTFVVPIAKAVNHVWFSPGLQSTRARAMTITFGGAFAALLFGILVPLPLHTTAEGVVWLPDRAMLRAATDGFVNRLLVGPGTRVRSGDEVILSEDPDSEAQIALLDARVLELRNKLAAQQFTDLSAAEISRFELAAARADLDHARLKARDLTFKSEADGTLMVPKSDDLSGRYFHQGEVIGYVIPDLGNIVRVTVTQDDIDLIRRGLRSVEVRFLDDMGSSYQAAVVREVPSASRELPSKALGAEGGGEIAMDPRDAHRRQSLQRVFEFDIAINGPVPREAFGSRVYVRFNHDWEPLAIQWYRRAKQVLLERLQP